MIAASATSADELATQTGVAVAICKIFLDQARLHDPEAELRMVDTGNERRAIMRFVSGDELELVHYGKFVVISGHSGDYPGPGEQYCHLMLHSSIVDPVEALQLLVQFNMVVVDDMRLQWELEREMRPVYARVEWMREQREAQQTAPPAPKGWWATLRERLPI